MKTSSPSRPQLIEVIKNLPGEVLPELANFLTYLQFKSEKPEEEKDNSGVDFLMAIAGLGEADEDLSERTEEILAEEIDPVRGWGFENKDNSWLRYSTLAFW